MKPSVLFSLSLICFGGGAGVKRRTHTNSTVNIGLFAF
jgi:hypothetical protein